MKLKIQIIFITLVLGFTSIITPMSANAAAIVKGEMPKVEPLQSLPPTTKPNYDHSVQSGEFESSPVQNLESPAVAEQTPLPAPIIKSGNNNLAWFSILALLVLLVIGYFLWKKIKLKQ